MREIKFRVWDTKMKSMEGDQVAKFWLSQGFTQHIYMQYTGLKDRHGVEIYEGDIIEYRAYMAWHRDVIKFTNGEFHGQLSGLKEEHQSRYSLGLIVSLGAEVIGNIYEHSHLLEVNQ